MSNMSQREVFSGLGTYSYTIPEAALWQIKVSSSISLLSQDVSSNPLSPSPVSSLVITVTQNGTTMYTGQTGAQGAQLQLTCALGDVIHIVFSSSATADTSLNAVKSTISLSD